MSDYLPTTGTLEEGDIHKVLYKIYRDSISGLLKISDGRQEKELVIENDKIRFASSNSRQDSLGNYLFKKNVIDETAHDKIEAFMVEKGVRFGRALIELGILDYEQLWTLVPGHLKEIALSITAVKQGSYRIITQHQWQEENIRLELDIPDLLIEAVRRTKTGKYIEAGLEDTRQLFVCDSTSIERLNLKPYERHVYELVKKYPLLADILENSELLPFDTLKVLYLLKVFEIVSPEKPQKSKKAKKEEEPSHSHSVTPAAFKSFDDALKHYNSRYELVYKVLSKEIGPIALSILSRALEDIMENLPGCFQRLKLNPNGTLNQDLILKSVWYHDFDSNGTEFLRGLEEILYAEIYTVRQHLGVEQEQQVLKWMNKTGN